MILEVEVSLISIEGAKVVFQEAIWKILQQEEAQQILVFVLVGKKDHLMEYKTVSKIQRFN